MSDDVLTALRTMTVKQLAEATDIPEWRLYQMISRGEAPPHFRIGMTYRFRVRDVDAWMAAQTSKASTR